MEGQSVQGYIISDDPLSIVAMEYLLAHSEEDEFVDYKQTFEIDNTKHLLSLTEDMLAFANTKGGYLVFGVEDGTYTLIGLNKDVERFLLDINKVLQKVNAYIEPELTRVRSKSLESGGLKVVVVYIPESKGLTHIIKKEGKYKFPSGAEKTKFHPGQIYVRRSASIAVVTSQDLNVIVERRIDYYKNRLLERIGRVVEAPLDQHVLVVDAEEVADGEQAKKFVVSDAPDAVPVKGMSFTIAPKNETQLIAGALAMKKSDPDFTVSQRKLWKIYSKRESIELNHEQIIGLSLMLLLGDIPVFYWISKLTKQEITQLLVEVVRSNKSIQVKATALNIGVPLGKTLYKKVRDASGDAKERLGDPMKKVGSDPSQLFHPMLIERNVRKWENPAVEGPAYLSALAEKCARKDVADVVKRGECWALDYYLYGKI